MTTHKRILIMSGEASGDLLGAHLAKAIMAKRSDVQLIGMGGSLMKAAGVDILLDSDKLAVVGALEVFKHLGDILSAMRFFKHLFKTNPPNLVIFIDYPGFNLRMAKHAHRAGIKVLYYVSPQIWAWRYGRIKQIKKYVDHMAVLLAFEEKLYQKENMPVSFVGHPVVDIATPTVNSADVAKRFDLDLQKPIIALFPGSRHNEISRLMPVIVSTVRFIQRQIPEAQFVLPLASSVSLEDMRDHLISDIQVIENNTYNVLPLCSAAIVASGTATLEIALHQVPMVIIYKVAPLSYWLGTKLIHVPYIGLCNLVAEQCVAMELIQEAVTVNTITTEIIRLVKEKEYHQQKANRLALVRAKLGGGGGSQKAASVALEML